MLQLVFPTSSSGFVEQSVASFHAFLRALVASSSGTQDKGMYGTYLVLYKDLPGESLLLVYRLSV